MATPTGGNVPTSVSYAQSIAFSAYGLLLKQKEVVEVTEYRGYTDANTAKTDAAAFFADTTGQTQLFHPISGNGFVMASVMTGSLTTAVAHRVNEANMWAITVTTTTYSWTAPTGSAWTETRPAAGNGFTSGIGKAKRVLTVVEGNPLVSSENTSTQEWRGCTAAEAATLVANCPADSLTTYTFKCTRIATELGRFEAQEGTRYTMESRYISDAEGYSVTKHTTTITVSGSNWSKVNS